MSDGTPTAPWQVYDPAIYQERQLLGLCYYCSNPRGRYATCDDCRVAHRKSHKAMVQRQKDAKLCQWGACPTPVFGTTYCLLPAAQRANIPSRRPAGDGPAYGVKMLAGRWCLASAFMRIELGIVGPTRSVTCPVCEQRVRVTPRGRLALHDPKQRQERVRAQVPLGVQAARHHLATGTAIADAARLFGVSRPSIHRARDRERFKAQCGHPKSERVMRWSVNRAGDELTYSVGTRCSRCGEDWQAVVVRQGVLRRAR